MAKKSKKTAPKPAKVWDGSLKDGELYDFQWHSDKQISVLTAEEVKGIKANISGGKVLGLHKPKG